MLFPVAGSFVLSLLSRPSASQAESGFPFFSTSYLPLFVERTPSSSFPSSSVSRSAVVFFVLVWTQLELGHFGPLVNSFVDSLGWSP